MESAFSGRQPTYLSAQRQWSDIDMDQVRIDVPGASIQELGQQAANTVWRATLVDGPIDPDNLPRPNHGHPAPCRSTVPAETCRQDRSRSPTDAWPRSNVPRASTGRSAANPVHGVTRQTALRRPERPARSASACRLGAAAHAAPPQRVHLRRPIRRPLRLRSERPCGAARE